MYVDSLACVRVVKWGEYEQFRIDSGVRQVCIMSPLLFNVYMDAVVKMGIGKVREWRLPIFLNADDLVCEVSRRRT